MSKPALISQLPYSDDGSEDVLHSLITSAVRVNRAAVVAVLTSGVVSRYHPLEIQRFIQELDLDSSPDPGLLPSTS
jgi:hypothetical protein